MKSKLMKWLAPMGVSVAVAMASLSVIRGERAQVPTDESNSYAMQRRRRSPKRTPSPSPSPSPQMSPTPIASPEGSPTPTPEPLQRPTN
jgi:hypothetical protein